MFLDKLKRTWFKFLCDEHNQKITIENAMPVALYKKQTETVAHRHTLIK